MGVGVSHGWEPMCGPLVANHTTGNIMIELNWQPALSIYRQILKEKAGISIGPNNFFEIAKCYPFGSSLNLRGYLLKVVLESGRPVVKTEHDDDFKDFCMPFIGNEKEVLLVPVEKLALIQLSFTHKGASGKVLAGILAGVAPKLGNAILSCLNHEKLLALERAGRRNSEMRYRDLVNNLDVGIYISTVNGHFHDVNPAFLKMFGLKDRQELFEFSWPSLYVNPREREYFMDTITGKGRGKNLEILFRRKDGETFWAQVTAVLRYSPEDLTQNVMGIVKDITERKGAEEKLQYLATHDSLTNIPNRYSLEEAVKRTVAKAKRGEKSALLLIDLDNFNWSMIPSGTRRAMSC